LCTNTPQIKGLTKQREKKQALKLFDVMQEQGMVIANPQHKWS